MATLYANNFLTWTPVKRIHVNDSGTWFRVKIAWENNGGTWRMIQTYGIGSSIVAGSYASPVDGAARFGFANYTGTSAGSIAHSPTMQDGRVLAEIGTRFDNLGAVVAVRGFSSNPGAGYLLAAWSNGGILHTSDASFDYSSVSGVATWSWVSSGGDFNMGSGSTYNIAVIIA